MMAVTAAAADGAKSVVLKAFADTVAAITAQTPEEAEAKECLVRIVELLDKREGFWRTRPPTVHLERLQAARRKITAVVGLGEGKEHLFLKLVKVLASRECDVLGAVPQHIG